MESVRQLDDDDADILDHGKKHLAQIFGLHFLLRLCFVRIVAGKLELLQLGDAVDQIGDIVSEHVGKLFFCVDRILDNIMQQSRGNGLLIHFKICQNDRHIQRMNNVGFPGLSLLRLVCLCGKRVCPFDKRDIIGRMISADAFDQIFIQDLRAQKVLDVLDSSVVQAFFDFLHIFRHTALREINFHYKIILNISTNKQGYTRKRGYVKKRAFRPSFHSLLCGFINTCRLPADSAQRD